MDFIFSLNSLQFGKKTLKKVSMKQIKLKETEANQTKPTNKQEKNPFKLWNNVWSTLRYTQKEQKMATCKKAFVFQSATLKHACLATFNVFLQLHTEMPPENFLTEPNWTFLIDNFFYLIKRVVRTRKHKHGSNPQRNINTNTQWS